MNKIVSKVSVMGITIYTKKCFLVKEARLLKEHTFLAASCKPENTSALETKGKELTDVRRLMSAPVFTPMDQKEEVRPGCSIKTMHPNGAVKNFFIDGAIPPRDTPPPVNYFFSSTQTEFIKKMLGKKAGDIIHYKENGIDVTCQILEITKHSEAVKIYFPEFQNEEKERVQKTNQEVAA